MIWVRGQPWMDSTYIRGELSHYGFLRSIFLMVKKIKFLSWLMEGNRDEERYRRKALEEEITTALSFDYVVWV